MKTKQHSWKIIKENLTYSLNISSITGVSYTAYHPKRSLLERIIWMILVIAMAMLATWHGLKVYTHYRERPAIVTVDKAYFDWKLIYPTLTVCFEELRSDRELKKIIKNLIDKYNFSEELLTNKYDDFVSYLRDLAFKNYTNYEDYKPYAVGNRTEFLQPEQYMEILDQVVVSLELKKSSASQKPSNVPLHFPLDETRPIKRIFTEWGPCMVANPNISIYYTPDYFNSTKPYADYEPIFYTVNTNVIMTLKKNLKSRTYIYFHAPNEVMDITDRRDVLNGQFFKECKYETEAVITNENIKDLSVQQKNCRLPYEHNEEPLKHSPVYSHNLCKFECRIMIALKYCNCTPYYYRRLGHEPICNLTGLYCLSQYKAQLTYMTNMEDLCSPCPQNCDVGIFREVEVIDSYEFLQTTFYMYMTFPDKMYIRNLIFSKIDLVVQIGGIFSLFLGCSLLSLVEIIYSLSLRLFCGIKFSNKIRL